jgi:small-conductance mechanosensitive channel
VRKLFKKIGQQIMAESENADDLLAPFKSQGAADVTDVGIVIRGKFTAKPGGQWMIRREIYTRVQKAFEENGIEFARREVRVKMAEGDDTRDLTEAQKTQIAGAASEAAEPPKP